MASPTPSFDDAFKDSLNFVKKVWGGMNVPGMNPSGMPTMQSIGMPAPTMSLEELDKRIQELKSVEAWLNVNISMLHNTVQALEIQRATIATLHSLSSTMAQTMQGSDLNVEKVDKDQQGGDDKKNKEDASAEVSPLAAQSAAWWNTVQEQFKQALGIALTASPVNPQTAKPATATQHAKKPAAKMATKAATSAATKTASKVRSAAPSKRKTD